MLTDGPVLARERAEGQAWPDPQPEAEAAEPCALIGPNAVLQAVAAMLEHLGEKRTRAVLENSQISQLPVGDRMIPEIEAIRLHRWLTMREPVASYAIATDSGTRTADYIIANRIPKVAVWLLQHLPASLAAPLLMKAIRQHAWTFIGAGRFEPRGAWNFTIDRTQADDAVLPPDTLFHWYAAVFARLYQRLVAEGCTCRDIGAKDAASLKHEYVIEARAR